MLVLSRKELEEFLIGHNIVVRVHKISGNRVQLAIEAPRSVPVVRGELRDPPAQAERATA
jgi:carbon storage regulator